MRQISEAQLDRSSESKIRTLLRQYIAHKYMFALLLPVLIYFGLFHYGPMYGVLIAFKDFKILKGVWGSAWVGFEHFKELFSGLYFKTVLRNTLIINFYKLIIGFPAPILLALMVNEVLHARFKKFVQTVSYLPHFLSWVVLSGLLIEFLSPSRGFVNMFLDLIGMKPIFFLTEPSWFRSILVGSEIWKGAGFTAILYLAAIAGINPEVYEAAEVDGINRLQKIWYITLPSIIPIIVIMVILQSGQLINDDFEQVFNLLNVKVMEVGDVLSTYTYAEGLSKMNYSYAAAVGLFKNVVALLLVFATNLFARKVSEETLF